MWRSLRVSLFAIVIASVLIEACSSDTQLESGVSYELAKWRSEAISDLHYDMEFYIPSSLSDDVVGRATLSFDYCGNEDLPVDFKADSVNQILEVSIEGKPIEWSYADEHIILPVKYLDKRCEISIDFIAGNRSLNRSEEYLYTLAVPDRARTIYPCFDQPDIKSRYTLKLYLPESWVAISGSRQIGEALSMNGAKCCKFETSLPMSTYHFAFVAGKFECYSEVRGADTVNFYYRETDPYKVGQVKDVVDLTYNSVAWLEDYTGISMPYTKNDLVAIPGFQFGGMEHPGAIFYADNVLFKEKNATPEDYFQRASTIAHENTHLWFGDLVTMKWFNDVWTKEVFANYISAKIIEPEFPELDHNLNFMTSYIEPAMAEDRTSGTNAIQQQLDNMQRAGLLYGNIIYDKAPVMMRNLEHLMGSERFRAAIQEYLKSFYHANATWDDLIAIMASHAPEIDIERFSQVWVKEKGMPHIIFTLDGNSLRVEQSDPYNRGLVWPQTIKVALVDSCGKRDELSVAIESQSFTIPLSEHYVAIVPNIDGMGYGRITANIDYLLDNWEASPTKLEKQAVLIQLYEAYLNGELNGYDYYKSLLTGVKGIEDVQVSYSIVNQLFTLLTDASEEMREEMEDELFALVSSHRNGVIRGVIYRGLATACGSDKYIAHYYKVWSEGNDSQLTENNYINLALSLAIKMPEEASSIIDTQRGRIKNGDVLRRYDFVSPACSSDKVVMDSVFNALLVAENRAVEPWVQSALSYLNSRYREPYSNKYLLPALMELQEVQRTGDIFFPKGWCGSLLSGHRSEEALQIVHDFLSDNPDYPQLLKTKLLQSVYNLERIVRR